MKNQSGIDPKGIAFGLFVVAVAVLAIECSGIARAEDPAPGPILCDPPDACPDVVCSFPNRCVPAQVVATCGTLVPETCEDFEASMVRIFRESEAPTMPAGLLARIRSTAEWKQRSRLDAARLKTLRLLREWVEAYVTFKAFQPDTPSTGRTVTRWRSEPPAEESPK